MGLLKKLKNQKPGKSIEIKAINRAVGFAIENF